MKSTMKITMKITMNGFGRCLRRQKKSPSHRGSQTSVPRSWRCCMATSRRRCAAQVTDGVDGVDGVAWISRWNFGVLVWFNGGWWRWMEVLMWLIVFFYGVWYGLIWFHRDFHGDWYRDFTNNNGDIDGIYPLVNIQKAIENGHRNSWFSH